jgi:protein SCO1/2
MKTILLPALAITLAAGAITLQAGPPRSTTHDYDPPVPGSYALPVVKAAGDGEVLDQKGHAQRLHDLVHGRVTVMSFIYTRCADAAACPYATGVLMELHELSAEDKNLAQHMRLVSMSFDPAHDTPEQMSAYARIAEARPSAAEWRFVTTSSRGKLNPILAAYGQAVDAKKNAADRMGPLNHTLRVYLIDREGRVRNIYSSGTLDVRLVLADVKTLLLEEQSANHQAR